MVPDVLPMVVAFDPIALAHALITIAIAALVSLALVDRVLRR